MLREEEELETKINILKRQINSGCNNANEKLSSNQHSFRTENEGIRKDN